MVESKLPIVICDECQSEYYEQRSEMTALCPECASILYGYPPCSHIFVNGRCTHCYWNGNRSRYVLSLMAKAEVRDEI